jgi:hypothetical protein
MIHHMTKYRRSQIPILWYFYFYDFFLKEKENKRKLPPIPRKSANVKDNFIESRDKLIDDNLVN